MPAGSDPDSAPLTAPALVELRIADDQQAWIDLGFTLKQGLCWIGGVLLRFQPPSEELRGIVGWTLTSAVADGDIDGLPTQIAALEPATVGVVPESHANGACLIDHVVVTTADLTRTFAALKEAGLDLRRIRDAGPSPSGIEEVGGAQTRISQGFYRLGPTVLEVVGPNAAVAHATPVAAFWGIAVVVASLGACCEALSDRVGDARDAVQPGRRIASVKRSAGLGLPLAFMSAEPADR